MLYSLMFLLLFVIGGLAGITLSAPPIDYQVHNTTYLVAYFHNMLIPGTLFGMLAGYSYWFPKAFGFRLDERWGRIAAGCLGVGFLLAFMPLYVLGAAGMARRSATLDNPLFTPWLWAAALGALLLTAGLVSFFTQLWLSIRRRQSLAVPIGDPWDGRALEWSTASPPPSYNFAKLPKVQGRDAFWSLKERGDAYPPVDHFEPIEVPRNSAVPVIIGVASYVCTFGLVWHIGWAAILGLLAAWAAVIARSFVRDTHRQIGSAQLQSDYQAWRLQALATQAVPREMETTSANLGRAQVPL